MVLWCYNEKGDCYGVFLKKSKLKKEFIFKFIRVFMILNAAIQRINLTKLWDMLMTLLRKELTIQLHFINRKFLS